MSSETREALLASLPPGVREMLADDVVALFDATASTIDDSAVAAVDEAVVVGVQPNLIAQVDER